MDPFALPCHSDLQHSELQLTADDRDWRQIGVKSADEVLRKQTTCPACKTRWTAFLRTIDGAQTVEWVQPTPFRVRAAPLPGDAAVLWQDDATDAPAYGSAHVTDLHGADLHAETAGLGPAWERSVQRVAPVHVLTTGGRVFAEPGDLLLERREKWNAQDRRLALLWAPRLQRQVVAWHGFARLLQPAPA